MQNVKARSGLFVRAEVRGVKINLLVDTGATDTLLSCEFYHQIPKEKRPAVTMEGARVRNADGSVMETIGSAWVEVQVGRTTCPLSVVFGNTGKIQGILGMDFLLATKGVLDFQTMELKVNGERIRCVDTEGNATCARVIVSETTRVPAGHEALVPGCVTGAKSYDGLAVIEPAEKSEIADKGMVVARVLVRANEETLPIRVFNPGKMQCVVKKGTMAGSLTPVSEADVDHVTLLSQGAEVPRQVPDHLTDLLRRSTEGVDHRHHNRIGQLLCDYRDIFSADDDDIGRTDLVKHHIHTGDARPIKERPRR